MTEGTAKRTAPACHNRKLRPVIPRYQITVIINKRHRIKIADNTPWLRFLKPVTFVNKSNPPDILKLPRTVKGVLDVLLTLPLVLPPTVCGYFLLRLFGARRPLGRLLLHWGVRLAMHWTVGVAAAALSAGMWNSADGKERLLWPNHASTDNHALFSDGFIFILNFCSPGVVEGRIR